MNAVTNQMKLFLSQSKAEPIVIWFTRRFPSASNQWHIFPRLAPVLALCFLPACVWHWSHVFPYLVRLLGIWYMIFPRSVLVTRSLTFKNSRIVVHAVHSLRLHRYRVVTLNNGHPRAKLLAVGALQWYTGKCMDWRMVAKNFLAVVCRWWQ